MKRSSIIPLMLFAALGLLGQPKTAHAAITWTGDIDPSDPTTWTSSITGYIGKTADGTLEVNGGSGLASRSGYIAYNPGVTGQVTVTGATSTWTNSYRLYVGVEGDATLTIGDGAAVTVDDKTHVALTASSTGTIVFGPGGGTLTTESLFVAPAQLAGVGSVSTCGLVSDVDLTFSTTEDLLQTLRFNSEPGQDVTIDLDASGMSNMGELGVGYLGNGSLTIQNGIQVPSSYGWIGYHPNSMGEVIVTGSNSLWYHSGFLYAGYYGEATLDITDDASLINNNSYLGYYSGSTGTVNIEGAYSTWTTKSDLIVGRSGSGVVSISDGGTVTSTTGYLGQHYDSTGLVTVDGAGTSWVNSGNLYVGYHGDGTLRITNGGEVTVDGTTYVGLEWQSTGKIDFGPDAEPLTTGSLGASPAQLTGTGTINARGLVSDVDLVLDTAASLTQAFTFNSEPGQNIVVNLDLASAPGSNGALGAGWEGNGSLTIRNGISVNSTLGFIGTSSHSTGVASVDGAGSAWNHSGYLHVGYRGKGTLTITNGGAVVGNGDVYGQIGTHEDSMGEVTVTGTESSWTGLERLKVGGIGNGTLAITDGGTVASFYGSVGSSGGSNGEVMVSGAGSTWNIGGLLYVGFSGNGTLAIIDGGLVTSTWGHIGSTASSSGAARVSGAGAMLTVSEDLWAGRFGSGSLTITNGGLTAVAGTLAIDYNGNGDGFVNMSTGGMLALFGDADDSLVSFLDLVDGTDAIRYWDDSIADWADITGATYGADYTLSYLNEGDLYGYTLLTVGTIPIPGDANGDNRVDQEDAATLAAHWGQSGHWSTGDFDGDGVIGPWDAAILAAHWGYGTEQTGESSAVPEPGVLVTLLIGVSMLLVRRGR